MNIKLPIKYRPYNSGGKGGQHSNRSLNAVEVSVTLPDGRRIVASSGSHKSQFRNKAVAEKALLKKIHIALMPKVERRTTMERVRTYHEPRNEVVDHASGERRAYVEVMDDDAFGELVDARRKAIIVKKQSGK